MLSADLCTRLLALPPDTRAKLATVEGPGWVCYPTGGAVAFLFPKARDAENGKAWWPANPIAAVAAVLGIDDYRACDRLSHWLQYNVGDTNDAALAIIEAHVASRSST